MLRDDGDYDDDKDAVLVLFVQHVVLHDYNDVAYDDDEDAV